MKSLWQHLVQLPQAKVVGTLSEEIERVHSDTRSLQMGDLFVALRGENFDAHDYLLQAHQQGAVAALAEHGLEKAGLVGVEVPNTKKALGQFATSWRAQFDIPLIAVTGSNGKTTVTQMIASILSSNYCDDALATKGNFNNDIGVPLTLLRLRKNHQAAVVELGMNHIGEISQLAAMAAPTVGLVNNAQREHLEFMGTVDAVARENGAVISALASNGVAVFPVDSNYSALWKQMAKHCSVLTFTTEAEKKADVYASQISWVVDHWNFTLHTPETAQVVKLHIAGKHNIANALAAAACAYAIQVPMKHIVRGLEGFAPVAGRSQVMSLAVHGHNITLINDTYNANPDSVIAAIDVLRELPAPHLLILGDMGEVGADGVALHSEVGAYAQAQGIEHVLTLGDLALHSATSHNKAKHCGGFNDIEILLQTAKQILPQVKSVLVKGSRFMKMERLIDQLQQHIAEQEGALCS